MTKLGSAEVLNLTELKIAPCCCVLIIIIPRRSNVLWLFLHNNAEPLGLLRSHRAFDNTLLPSYCLFHPTTDGSEFTEVWLRNNLSNRLGVSEITPIWWKQTCMWIKCAPGFLGLPVTQWSHRTFYRAATLKLLFWVLCSQRHHEWFIKC